MKPITLKNTKKIIIFTFFSLMSCALAQDFDDFDDLTAEDMFDSDFDDYFEEFEERRRVLHSCKGDLPPADVVVAILASIGLPAILRDHNFYKRTNPINIRSLLDLPSLQPQFDCSENWALSTQLFFNYTGKVYFTENCPFISSYLDFTNADLIEKLIDSREFFPISIPDVLPLFANIKFREYRVGFMFATHKRHKCFEFTAMLPFFYQLHHFFLTDEEIEAIQNNPLFRDLNDTTDQGNAYCFGQKHLASTKLGFGDLRLITSYNAVHTTCADIWLGAQVTFPTAHALHGKHIQEWFGDTLLFGGRYCKSAPPPPLDLQEILCLLASTDPQESQAGRDEVVNFFIGALDKLTANVADRSLGQDHYSIGPVLGYTQHLTPCTSWVNTAEIDYLFPKNEPRFFIVQKNPADFNRDYDDLSMAVTNLAFLTEQITNFFYPTFVDIKVKPGAIIKLSTAVAYDAEHVHAALGYDFWYQKQERFGCYEKNSTTPTFLLDQGRKSRAYQSKLFGRISGNCNNWYVGFSTDITVSNKGIGRDFTAALDFVYYF